MVVKGFATQPVARSHQGNMSNPDSTRTELRGDGTPIALPRLHEARASREDHAPGPGQRGRPPLDRRRFLAAVGLLLLPLCHPHLWDPAREGMWFPFVGLGLALVAWLGPWAAVLVAAADVLVEFATLGPGVSLVYPIVAAAIVGAEVGLGWWVYHVKAGGARRLDDPRSAVLFLILIPAAAASLSAFVLALAQQALASPSRDLLTLASSLWLAHGLGFLALSPALLALATPWLMRQGFASATPGRRPLATVPWPASWGEAVEASGLVMAAGVVGVALAVMYTQQPLVNWPLSGLLLLLVVWTSLRQGLPGGSLAAAAATVLGLSVASAILPQAADAAALLGHFLAQCSVALLVGASVGWIRASEAHYRQFVGHMPVVLYSVRLLGKGARHSAPDAEVTLVSPASKAILGCTPEDLIGDYRAWLEHIHPDDRELMIAALAQLCLQKQPVTCEYRLAGATEQEKTIGLEPGALPRANVRWVRDTLAPRHTGSGELEGWEGVVEDITEQRVLAADLRRTTAMLQALVNHLPTGVFFVHGPLGQPLYVNARARQLLGQREDMAASLAHLPRVYRLHRPDGTPYPWEELSVSRALRLGVTGMRDDVVVHRPDGRRIPLVTWAAPVNLGGQDKAGAVWVLEDLSALRQAEAAHHAAEARLRTIIETMGEGLVVQSRAGRILEWNPAACSLLGVSPAEIARLTSLGPDEGCLREDGSPLPAEEHPARVSLRTRQPVRDMVMGIPAPQGQPSGWRWILVNTMLLPSTGERAEGQTVTTFADITAQRRAAEVMRQSEEKYRGLVEHLPLLVLQFDAQRRVTYLNPAARAVIGQTAGELPANLWEEIIPAADLPGLMALFKQAENGQSARGEVRFRGRDGSEHVGYALIQPVPANTLAPGTTLLLVDITQQRRLERELQRVQRLDLVGRLASGVVHDVNNWLTVMIGSVETVLTNLPQDNPACADLARVAQAGEQAKQLMGQLLAFSKDRRVAARRVDVNALVERNLELLRGAMPRSVEVRAELAPAGAWALAEETQLQQVLMNLCLNARDAMPGGGQLTVTTATVGRGGPQVRLSVRDTGHGMTEEVRGRIFELFFTTKERGSGLGLAVVKQIVESFTGRLEFTSCPGEGTCFDVWLPAAPAE